MPSGTLCENITSCSLVPSSQHRFPCDAPSLSVLGQNRPRHIALNGPLMHESLSRLFSTYCGIGTPTTCSTLCSEMLTEGSAVRAPVVVTSHQFDRCVRHRVFLKLRTRPRSVLSRVPHGILWYELHSFHDVFVSLWNGHVHDLLLRTLGCARAWSVPQGCCPRWLLRTHITKAAEKACARCLLALVPCQQSLRITTLDPGLISCVSPNWSFAGEEVASKRSSNDMRRMCEQWLEGSLWQKSRTPQKRKRTGT